MEHMAEAYQRVRFKKLVFRIVPMASTSSSGGFAAAFVADPTDVLGSGDDALDRLVAQKGSKITKIWQSTTVNGAILPDLLYTSEPPQGDQRLSSPGRLWVVIESKVTGLANAAVPLTVYCDWEVDFYVPSLEKGESGTTGSLVVQSTFFTRASNVGLWWSRSAGGDDPRSKIPGIEFDVTYRTKQKYYLSYSKAGNFDKFRMVNDVTHGVTLAPVDPDGKVLVEKTDIDQYVFEKGDVLTPVPTLNSVGVEYLCHKMQRRLLQAQLPPEIPPLSKKLGGVLENKPSTSLRQSRTQNFSREERIRALSKEFLMGSPQLSRDLSRSPSFEVLDDDDNCGV